MLSAKAVDVVLLPGRAVRDKAIELNAELFARFGSKIVLDRENCLPHVSLAMGCIGVADLGVIEKALADVARQFPVGQLKIVRIDVSTNSAGEKISSFVIERTEPLELLHEKVMAAMQQYFNYDVTADMIYGDDDVDEGTLGWIKNYSKESSFANFQPHITLGYGWIEGMSFSGDCVAERLALCHLGNHCTCREVLISVKLKD